MSRYHGVVGYGKFVEKSPGVFDVEITERAYFGDVLRNVRNLQPSEYLHDDLRVSNSISIVADAYANEHFFAIRYVEWAGAVWTVTDVEVQSPRLILTIGGAYNGPKGEAASRLTGAGWTE